MNNGFGILEAIIVLTLSLMICSILITSVFESTSCSKKVNKNQQMLESIFHTVDTIKSDLSKCGMRLQEAGQYYKIDWFEKTQDGFKVTFGVTTIRLGEPYFKGNNNIGVEKNEFLRKNKMFLIYHPDSGSYEIKKIKEVNANQITTATPLQSDYFRNAFWLS